MRGRTADTDIPNQTLFLQADEHLIGLDDLLITRPQHLSAIFPPQTVRLSRLVILEPISRSIGLEEDLRLVRDELDVMKVAASCKRRTRSRQTRYARVRERRSKEELIVRDIDVARLKKTQTPSYTSLDVRGRVIEAVGGVAAAFGRDLVGGSRIVRGERGEAVSENSFGGVIAVRRMVSYNQLCWLRVRILVWELDRDVLCKKERRKEGRGPGRE
jgi:hypothetical protein